MPILYTAVGHASSDKNRSVISFVYTGIGYTNNDINLGCITIGKIGLSRAGLEHGYLGIEINSLQHCGDTLLPVFRMSENNIVRKREVLETINKPQN